MAQTAKQYSYTSASAYIYSDISVTHVAGSTNVTVSATSHMYSGGSSYSGITRYMCLVINGTTYYNCGSRSGSFSSKTTYNSWISGSKTINVGTYGSGSLTVGVYISASSSSLSSSGTFIWNGKTSTSTSDCSLKTVTVSYGVSATKVGAPGTVTSTTYVKSGSNVTISWGGASGGTNNPVAYYRVWYRFNGGSGWGSWVLWKDQISSSSRSYTGALSSLGTWQFDVVAVGTISALGNSETYASNYTYTWSNVSNPSGLTVSSGTQYQTGSFTLKWSAASAGTNNGISYYTINGTSVGNVTSKAYSKLTDGTSTTYTLKTVGARGDTSSGISYTVYNPNFSYATTKPTLSLSGVYTNSLTVSWHKPTNIYPSNATIKYDLQKSINGDSWTNVVTDTTANSYNATETAGWGQKVKFQVRAKLYVGSTVYRTSSYTSTSDEIMRGQKPNYIESIQFDNSWYSDDTNTGWPFEDSDTIIATITGSSNAAVNFSTYSTTSYFTVGKHTKLIITLNSNTSSTGNGSEKIYINNIGIPDSDARFDADIRTVTIDNVIGFFSDYITSLTIKLVNIYSNTEVDNGTWTISNVRKPLPLSLKIDEEGKSLAFTNFNGGSGQIDYNCAINEENPVTSLKGDVHNIILTAQAPWVDDDAEYNKNIGFKIETCINNGTWTSINLVSPDVTHVGSSNGGTYEEGYYFPNYEGGSTSRKNESLTLNLDLSEKLQSEEYNPHWYPGDQIDFTTFNGTLNLKYRIAPINKYLYADGDTTTVTWTEVSIPIDTSTLLTLPEHPFMSKEGQAPPVTSINIGDNLTIPINCRVINNGITGKKSYLVFDFYAGFDSNEFYKNEDYRYYYDRQNDKYYLKCNTQSDDLITNDPCNYQITFFSCINSDGSIWSRKYEWKDLTKYADPYDESSFPVSGCTPYGVPITVNGENIEIQKYRGWYQINLTNKNIDEFIQVGIRPYLSINKCYAFPSEIPKGSMTEEDMWRMYDIDTNVTPNVEFPAHIWVASTQSPKLAIDAVERNEDNTKINIRYKILDRGTGSTYICGLGDQGTFNRGSSPSDQQLEIDFKFQVLNDPYPSASFGTHIKQITTLNSLDDNLIPSSGFTTYNLNSGQTLSDSQSYTFLIYADVEGTQYGLSTSGLPEYKIIES